MCSPSTHRARAAGLLVLALGLAACSSPTPNRPLDSDPIGGGDAAAGTPAAPSSNSGFRTDPISGGPEVWDEIYGTAPPDQGYPAPILESPTDESPYPGPDGESNGAAVDEGAEGAATSSANATAAPTKSGG